MKAIRTDDADNNRQSRKVIADIDSQTGNDGGFIIK